MDKKDETRSANLPGKGLRFYNRNFLVFAFFILVSFIFWYLNSLGKDIEADIKFPVSYINVPAHKLLTGNPPERLNLYLKGPGYSLLRLKVSGIKAPVIIDFSRVSYKRMPNGTPNEYYLVTSGLVSRFNAQLKSACKITSIKPDTLFFSFSQTQR